MSSSILAQEPFRTAGGYLALGDSLAYGFNPFVDPPQLSKYIGYPEIDTAFLQLKLANASCPGETSTSFITGANALPGYICGPSPFGTVYTSTGAPVVVPIPLFVSYGAAKSQLQYALTYLQSNPNTKLITINIGGNDLAPLLTCTGPTCQALAVTLLTQLGQNLGYILTQIRGAGYAGSIVITNYSAFNYKDPLEVGPTGAFTALNATLLAVATAFHAKVADVFTAFQIASGSSGDPCKAGLLVKIPNATTCDTHPSLEGQALIAGVVLYEVEK